MSAGALAQFNSVSGASIRVVVFQDRLHSHLCYTSNDEAFGYLKRVIVTPAVYPRFIELLHFDIQSTGQKSRCVNVQLEPIATLCFN